MTNIKLYSRKTVLTFITVLMIIISTVSYTLSTLTNAQQKVTQDITDFSRGSYDILLRPANMRTQLEEQLNLIEENYLGIGNGGITIQQWEEIKKHTQVEVAAPVASIGLFTARERTWMIRKDKQESQYYEVNYNTSDGVHTFTNQEPIYIYDFGEQVQQPFQTFPSSLDVLNNYLGTEIASFIFPASYHQVVAVDSEEEGKLTDYDFSPLTEKVNDSDAYKGGEFSIPIMSLRDVTVPISIELTKDDLADVSEKELVKWESEFMNGNPYLTLHENPIRFHELSTKYIDKKRLHRNEKYEFIPENGHSPFVQNLLYVNEDMELSLEGNTLIEGLGGTFDYHSQRIGYKLSPVKYEVEDSENLSVKQIGVDKLYDAPIYRGIKEVEFYQIGEDNNALNDDEFIGFVENGTFSIVENADSLGSAPLGIYGRETPYLASDPSVKLHPSAVPGSFITTPAHGLISLEWAEKMKGDAPIDAIRVKVAGISGYDKSAASLIRDLADEWEEKGFTVDIVAGASLRDLTVNVEGLGEIIQSFTSLGAVDTVLSSLNALQVMLTIFYGLVTLTFVSFTFFNLLIDRQRDEQLLAKLGWSQNLILQMRYKEWSRMLGIPIIFCAIAFTLWGFLKGQWLLLLFSLCTSGVFILLFVLVNYLNRKQPQQFKGKGQSVTVQNIRFYRFHLLAACIQLFLTTILTCFLPFFILQNVKSVVQTRLGSYIHGEIEGGFIVVIVLLYILSFTTVYRSLRRIWEKRTSEIQLFKYIGWEPKVIRMYFLKEILLWAGFSIVSGWVISLFIAILVVEVTFFMILSGIIGFIFILIVTLGGSIYTLHRFQIKGGSRFAHKNS